MSSKGGYAAPPRSHGGGGFYNLSAMRHQQQIFLQQQQQQMMQRQLLQQQKKQQRQLQRAAAVVVKRESSTGEEAEKRDGAHCSSTSAALSVPPSVGSTSVLNVTNLDRLMESVTPYVPARNLSEVNARDLSTQEVDLDSFFCLEDLWESFNEWSVCGAGVPLLLNRKDLIVQYYVPFLSGMQLYIDPSKPSSRLRDESDADLCRLPSIAGSSDPEADKKAKSISDWSMQQLNKLSPGDKFVAGSSSSEGEIASSAGLTLFNFLEHEQPHYRRPLTDKILALASQYPELSKCRSCDLHPTSWICVAWYPIYRIPIGPTLRDLDACFLTFHSLSTQSRSNFAPQFHAANTRTVCGIVDPTAKISLPVFGLASYKLKGSIVSPCGPQECEQENSLLESADNWLRGLHVVLPDYQFFRAHYTQWR